MKRQASVLVIIFFLFGFLASLSAHAYAGDKGDVNNDGAINVLDALAAVNHILDIVPLNEQGFWRADCNAVLGRCTGDNVVNVLDVVKIVNIILGIDACEKLADNTVVVDEQGNLSLEHVQDSTYYYSFHDSLPDISPGDIIMDRTGTGHLRKIVSFEVRDTVVIVETEFATLTDAIEACALDTTIHVQIGTPGNAKRMGLEICESDSSVVVVDSLIEFHNKVLFEGNIEGTDVYATIPQGYISFSPDIDIQMTIMESELTRFQFVVRGHLIAAFDMNVTCSDSFECSEKIPFISFPLPPITVDPVVFAPTLSFDAGFDAHVNFGGALTSGCETNDSMAVGAIYEAEVWSSVDEIGAGFVPHPIQWDGQADAELRGYILPSVSVDIYSVAGPYVEVEPYFQFSGEGGQPCWEGDLTAGIDGLVAIPGQIFEWQLADYDSEFSFAGSVIAETTNCIPPTAVFSVTPDIGSILTEFQVDASGCYDDKDPASALEVRWDWEDDGTYDTGWTTTKTASHQYSTTGIKTIKLEVKDAEGLTDMETHQVTVDFLRCGTVTDVDGNTYQTIQIGSQCWMAENLRVTHYRNGDVIPNVTESADWIFHPTGAYCNHGNDANNVATYGRLYNWHALYDSRNIAPEGWHIPTNAEWQILIDYLGDGAGGKMKEVGTSHWSSPNTGATNESGFTALPGGYRSGVGDGAFSSLGTSAWFWSSTEYSYSHARGRVLNHLGTAIGDFTTNKPEGLSVRCIKNTNNAAPTASFAVLPDSGTTTTFNVDASGSTDSQDPTSALQVRWDWENDGTYDTGWTTTKTASHLYSITGTKTIKLEVKDTGGLSDTETKQVTVSSPCPTTVTDIDGNVYQTIGIGGQCWMAENLKVAHYRNGDAIPNVTGNAEWASSTTGAYCNYNNNASYVATYGRLYNWYAVDDSRNVAPEGWHVPSDAEWKQLEMYLGMSQAQADSSGTRGTNEGSKLAGNVSLWDSGDLKNNPEFGTSGFTALPAGFRYNGVDHFVNMHSTACFWTSTPLWNLYPWYRSLRYDSSKVDRSYGNKPQGFAIRCVKD